MSHSLNNFLNFSMCNYGYCVFGSELWNSGDLHSILCLNCCVLCSVGVTGYMSERGLKVLHNVMSNQTSYQAQGGLVKMYMGQKDFGNPKAAFRLSVDLRSFLCLDSCSRNKSLWLNVSQFGNIVLWLCKIMLRVRAELMLEPGIESEVSWVEPNLAST